MGEERQEQGVWKKEKKNIRGGEDTQRSMETLIQFTHPHDTATCSNKPVREGIAGVFINKSAGKYRTGSFQILEGSVQKAMRSTWQNARGRSVRVAGRPHAQQNRTL